MTNAVNTAQLGSTQTELGFKNRVINGDMRIDQRNNGTSQTPVGGLTYFLDRWHLNLAQSSKVSIQQNAGGVTPPAGFTNYLGLTSLSAYSIVAGDYHTLRQPIEGVNIADLSWGTADAKAITVSFWVRSNLTGIFGGCLNNGAFTRGYPYTYTITSPNTWEYKTVTIPGDTTGSWTTDNSAGLLLGWTLGTGSTYNTGVTNAWNGITGGGYSPLAAAGVTNILSTNGATLYITGVQLEIGTLATGFDNRNYGTELLMCQRYYEYGMASGSGYAAITSIFDAGAVNHIHFKATKRAVPTMSAPSLAGNTYPNSNYSRSVPDYEGGYSRGFRYTTINGSGFWNVTTGNGGSTGVAGFAIVWTALAEL